MTINLPQDLKELIQAEVARGRFASIDEAMAEAARLLLRELSQTQSSFSAEASPDPVLGCMRDDAELMDEIVAAAYRLRHEDSCREVEL
jgi:Arc/MetJ-type ribon-helix-helix transcriptional regulator